MGRVLPRGDNRQMPAQPIHQRIAAHAHRVPPPFRAFAVRSDEACHALQARAPYGWVHRVRTAGLDDRSLASLAAAGLARVQLDAFPDVEYATTSLADLAITAPGAPDLAGILASALQRTGVLGDAPADYRRCMATRIDYLACGGAGFHNDVSGHWSRCLFWVLALAAADVAFVMPHAGVHLPLAPGDLLVFDQTMAHGLCRPRDGGRAMAASFETGTDRHQVFLTGELRLTDAQWAALGSPWLPVDAPQHENAIDLMVASFDASTGTVQRLGALRDSMRRSTCHADEHPQRPGQRSSVQAPAPD